MKHSSDYRDLAIGETIKFPWSTLDAVDRIPSCYVDCKPMRTLLVANQDLNCIDAITVADAKGSQVTQKQWFKNKLDKVVGLSYCEEQVCAGLDDGVILMLGLDGKVKRQISAQIGHD